MPTKKESSTSTTGAAKKEAVRTSAASHVLIPGSARSMANLAKRVRDVGPQDRVEVTLTLRGPSLPGADARPAKSLTSSEFQKAYGASTADVSTVSTVLEKFGLTITNSSLATRSVQVAGTAAQMEAAFRPNLGIYVDAAGKEFRDRQGTYAVPEPLGGIVTAVIGFGQRSVARRRVGAIANKPATPKPLAPKDIESLYRFPGGTAAGQRIGIAEFGGGFFREDLMAYCKKFGRRVPTVKAIAINRPAYTLKQILALPDSQRKDALDASVEVMMDIEIIAGLCPDGTLIVYFASFDQKGWIDLLNKAIDHRPVVLSVSWGLAEDDPEWSKAARDAINERLNAAALLGITVCVASGDDGSGDEETDGRAHVDFPASSPFVLGVGGTMIAGPLTPASERVWWDSPGRRTSSGGGSTGGGVSMTFPRPAWQTVKAKSVNKESIDGRVVPDAAALAGEPLYDLVVLNRDAPNGGTSAAAPVWAALIARIDANLPVAKRQRFLTPLLYQAGPGGKPVGAVACNDITRGNNTSHPHPAVGYSASAGFDAVSGWGTPRGTDLQAALNR